MLRFFTLLMFQGTLLILLAVFLNQYPGSLQIAWLGYEIEVSVTFAVIGLLLLHIAILSVLKVFSTILHFPAALKNFFDKRRDDKSLNLMVQAIGALAAQDVQELEQLSGRLEKLPNSKTAAAMLMVQASVMGKNYDRGLKTLASSVESSPEARVFYCMKFFEILKAQGQNQKALEAVSDAKNLRPKNFFIRVSLVTHLLEMGHFEDVVDAIDEAYKKNKLFRGSLDSHKLKALLRLAEDAMNTKRLSRALYLYKEAYGIDGGATAYLYARCLMANQKNSQAQKVIEESWPKSPSDDLSSLYLEVVETHSEIEKFKTIQRLVSFAGKSEVSYITVAKAAIQAKLWGIAHEHLNQLIESGNRNPQVYELMAQLEMAEHQNISAANSWRQRALAHKFIN